MPAGDNPHSISEKKAALRESPKKSKNAVNQQARASAFSKDKLAATVGSKRPQPNAPLSPTNHHAPGNPGANGHLVYVRRRLETDHSKGGTSAGAESTTSLSSKKPAVGGPQGKGLKHQNNAPRAESASVSASPAAAASTVNVPHNQSSPVSTSLSAAAATVPALHPATLPTHLSLAKQSHSQSGPASASPSVAAVTGNVPHTQSAHVSASQSAAAVTSNVPHTQSAPVSASQSAAAATVSALHPATLPTHLSLAKQSHTRSAPVSASPATAAVTAKVPHTQSAPVAVSPAAGAVTAKVSHNQSAPVSASQSATAATVPALHPAILSTHLSPAKQSPGKVAVHPSVVVTASPPQRNVVSTPMPQNFTAANTSPCNVAATSTAPHDAVATTTARNPSDSQKSGDEAWKARFLRLQAFLRNNEQSGQDEYIRMLQSLSSAGRSKHAIELEKRAVNLLIEEGKELQKMKSLNVLGKLPPTDHPPLTTQPAFGMRLPFQPFPGRR